MKILKCSALALVFALSACSSSGLKHVVKPELLAQLSADERIKVDSVVAEIASAQSSAQEKVSLAEAAFKEVSMAESKLAEAKGVVEAAEKTLENAKGKEKIAKSLVKHQKTVADNTADEAQGAAETAVDSAKNAHSESKNAVDMAKEALSSAKTNQKKAEKYLSFAKINSEAADAAVVEADRGIWVAQAQAELEKYEAVGRSTGETGPDYQAKLAEFQKQVANYQLDHSESKTEAAKKAAKAAEIKAEMEAI